MAKILRFNVATEEILNISEVADPSPFVGRADVLVDQPVVIDGPWRRWKVVNRNVVKRSQVELDAMDVADTASVTAEAERQSRKAQAIATLLSLKGVANPDAAQMREAVKSLIVLELIRQVSV